MLRPTRDVLPNAITCIIPVTPITLGRRASYVPIGIDRFEEDDEAELRAGGHTNGELVLAFLSANSGRAFTPKEVHEEMEIARGSVGVVLSRLEDRGLLRHRGEYWAIAPDADVDTTLSSLATARSTTDRFGPEDPEEWGPGVEEDA